MKKVKCYRSVKVCPIQKAKDLRKRFPRNKVTNEDHAMKIVNNMIKNLSGIRPGDLNSDFFDFRDVTGGIDFWVHVRSLLEKSAR